MKRLHRQRSSNYLRDFFSQTEFSTTHLIQPIFVAEGITVDEEIPCLLDTKRQTLESVLFQIEKDIAAGIRGFLLFPVPKNKKEKNLDYGFSAKVISEIKKRFSDSIHLWVDTCLCAYSLHGHCCILHTEGEIDLDFTLAELAKQSLQFANEGADGISPSDMMDGRVAKIRSVLNENGHGLIPIMSYSTKFASQFYGPFREAAKSAPQFGDRKKYQIDPRNRIDAIQSSIRCAEEGADLLMVKPGMPSIDLIREIQEKTNLPVGAYQVSGEFAALQALSEKKLLSFPDALLETWHVFRRAGAQYIITYGARYAKEFGIHAR